MPFPETPRVVFERNPLEEVICQLRFPPVLTIASEEPARFQELIRAQYPLYERDASVPVLPDEIREFVGRMLKMSEDSTSKFFAADRDRFIALNKEFIAVSDLDYRDWSRFRAEVSRAIGAVEEVYHPSFYSRIGLRYRNVIDREALELADVPWPDLLNDSLLGLLGVDFLEDRVQASSSQTVVAMEDGQSFVALRHGFRNRSEGEGVVYVIDADFYNQERRASDGILPILDTFNHVVGNLFRWAITGRLHEALRPAANVG